STVAASLTGSDVAHDLRLFVEDVSDSANVKVEDAGEPVHTVDELSKMFNVSTKTISRWREQGLVSSRFVFDGKRKRVGVLRSSVERFVAQNGEKVRRGERFSQLTDDERRDMIERARRLVRAGGCPSEVARRVAQHMNRSIETVRYTLKQFDKEHPEQAVFPEQTGVLTDDVKKKIYQQSRRGESVESRARRFCRTRTTIYRILNEMRARRILELPLDYMYHESFDKAAVEKEIMGPMPVPATPTKKVRGPSG